MIKKIRRITGALLLRVQMRFFGTTVEEKYWSGRASSDCGDWGEDDKEQDWIWGYWNSQSHPHRKTLIHLIESYRPRSVLEIGCNCGPNLFLLAQKFPETELIGMDINSAAIDRGKKFFLQNEICNVTLQTGNADNLKMFGSEQFDLVFTDAVLIYIGPDKIVGIMKEIIRVSRKSVVLLEWHCENSGSSGDFCGHWVRNYRSLVQEIRPDKKIRITQLNEKDWPDPKWQQYGHIIEIF